MTTDDLRTELGLLQVGFRSSDGAIASLNGDPLKAATPDHENLEALAAYAIVGTRKGKTAAQMALVLHAVASGDPGQLDAVLALPDDGAWPPD